jgi:hypothetical protein
MEKINLFTQIEFCDNCLQKCYTAMTKAGVCCIRCKLKCAGKISCPVLNPEKEYYKKTNLSAMQQVRKRNNDNRYARIGINTLFDNYEKDTQ